MTDRFSDALIQAMNKQLSVVDLFGTAAELQAQGRIDLAAALYQEWLRFNPDDPVAHAVYFNYSVILTDKKDFVGARDALLESVNRAPQFWPSHINLGTAYERVGDNLAAVNQWFHVINSMGMLTFDNLSYKKTALKQVARVLEPANCEDKAEECLRMSLEIDPDQFEVLQHWLAIRQKQCKWPVIVPFAACSKERLKRGAAPLTLGIYCDDPLFQLSSAVIRNYFDVGRPDTFYTAADFAGRRPAQGRPLRIGYVSSDYRSHAVGYLMSEMFEHHDRSKVEVWAYYCGPAVDDPVNQRIRAQVDQWHDLMGMDQSEAAKLLVSHEIDILVDVNGYTNFGLFKMFAMRPAPVIVNWLGYPGTLGSPYHHYIIADPVIIPPGSEIYYTEAVKRLPCYQPNDSKRVIDAETPTRAAMGLPEEGVVFCCFNGAQKLTPQTFGRWMEILRQVEGSVLWLLKGGQNADDRLREQVIKHGIAPERVIFAERMPNANHMARYPLADLFLDTLPYGAHTTASDSLWMGVPVVTIAGRGFAARVCASLVTAAGVPELVCNTAEEYVDLAVALGRDAPRRQALRQRLLDNRKTSVLFNTPLLVSSLEGVFAEMYDEFERGEMPAPKLTNLHVYHEIGALSDHETQEFTFLEDYHGHYLKGLAKWDSYTPLPPDGRLWSPAKG